MENDTKNPAHPLLFSEQTEEHAIEPRGTRLDALWERMLNTHAKQRAWRWLGPILVTALAGVLRLNNLGYPHSLVFDETFYVKDAYTLMQNGYESTWPSDADTAFATGNTDIYSQEGSFVVHPPLGKWVISLGIAAFGVNDATGWRIAVALCGIVAVFLLAVIAQKLFRSAVLGTLTGFLFAIDGHAIVMSRVGLLDGILMLFLLLGFGAILLDRSWHANRLKNWMAAQKNREKQPLWGPIFWWRPWLLAAAVAWGLASSVKWSGIYFLAAFAVYSVIVDALARRRAGLPFWFSAAVLKQAPATFVILVPLYLATYLATWVSWFNTSGGYYRNWAQESGQRWGGVLDWVPLSIQNFWHFQVSVYNFHVNAHEPHPYSANPLTWLLMLRPTQMYVRTVDNGSELCGSTLCYENITSVGNAVIWWSATAALLYLLYRFVRRREWRVGLILLGVAAGYLPWLMYLNRTVFQFYTIAFEPYLLLGLGYVIGLILGNKNDPTRRRQQGIWAVTAFLVLACAVTAFFYPVYTAQPIPGWLLSLHYWLPSWR